jgi:formylglycine-generating enzyme required for sulfatase activity/tRNA A-37 threonylcarbamoyl transferase component Bud32
MLNTTIKDYLIQCELGRGGMATVYLVNDHKFHTNVALKLLNKEYVHNDNIRKRFLAEARNMYRMSHPNIIKVTDLIDDGDTVAFVMEYIEGETLKDYLERKGKLSDYEIKSLFTQMLDAVGYVHEQKLIHRDIKPANFMITPNGKVKLMDFGIVKNLDASSAEHTQTGTGVQMGTPMYMSPEQVKSSKEVGVASDIYSLGVVLWQTVSGRKPYNSNTLSTVEIHIKILQESLEPTGTYWDKVIFKALEKEPSSRFSNSQIFKNSLESLIVIANDKTILEEKIIQAPISERQLSQTNKPLFNNATQKTSKNYLKVALVFLFLAVILGVFHLSNKRRAIEEEENVAIDSTSIADSIDSEIASAADTAPSLDLDTAADAAPSAPSLNIEWVNIPAGTFIMGSPKNEAGRLNEEIQHEVMLDGFKMSKYEVTFAQYDAFCKATGKIKPADEGWGRGNRPVINVSWRDAKAFADWAGARLPTEAQWEYACRAGTSSPFSTGDCLTNSDANYNGNESLQGAKWRDEPYSSCSDGTYERKTKPVGSYRSNAWGLYDMHGNVFEWCSDRFGDYSSSTQTNPQGPSSGYARVLRGGSWYLFGPSDCRSASRSNGDRSYHDNYIGFRLVSPM